MKICMHKPSVTLCLGLSAGLLVGVGMMIGTLVATQRSESSAQLPLHQLQAVATHGAESFAMATGPISDGVEGVFFLDFLTGELQCSVINPRTGTLGGAFRHNVIQDLGPVKDKNPSYLMVTGTAAFRVGTGNVRPADCVVYVMDANTGRYAAYSLPWNRQAINVGAVQGGPMALIGSGTARQLEIRE